MATEQTRLATVDDEDIGMLAEYVLCGWPSAKPEVWKKLQPYWSFKNEIVIIHGITMKGSKIIVPASLQREH